MASNIIGTAPDQISTNADLGDLAFQNKNVVEITGGRAALGKIDITKIDTTVQLSGHQYVYIYDTSLDSDGGQWRYRVQNTSWYNEPLNTNIRGPRKEFPALAIIVTTASELYILDGDDPTFPMWMMFPAGGYYDWPTGSHSWGVPVAKNGQICVATEDGSNIFRFIDDTVYLTYASSTYPVYQTKLNIANRALPAGYYAAGGATYYDNINVAYWRANWVDATVLPNTPPDPTTGLPNPCYAFAMSAGSGSTSGGVSIVLPNLAVKARTGWYAMDRTYFDEDSNLYVIHGHLSGVVGFRIYKVKSVYDLEHDYYYGHTPSETSPNISSGGAPGSGDSPGLAFAKDSSDTLYIGYNQLDAYRGLNILSEYPTSRRRGLIAYVKHTFNTGWIPGAGCQGAWLSTTDTGVIGDSGELVTNGNFTSSTGWQTQSGVSIGSGVATFSSAAHGTNLQRIDTPFVGGRAYILQLDVTAYTSGGLTIYANYNSGTIGQVSFGQCRGTGRYFFEFTPLTDGTGFTLQASTAYGGASVSMTVDDVSIREAVHDRTRWIAQAQDDSYRSPKGLKVIGNLIYEKVEDGAQLSCISGFSSSNYLEQPLESRLNPGTGDFCIVGWYKSNDTTNDQQLFRLYGGSQVVMAGWLQPASNGLVFYNSGSGNSTGGGAQWYAGCDGNWHQFLVKREGGVLSTWFDGKLLQSRSTETTNLSGGSSTTTVLRLGMGDGNYPMAGSMALWRWCTGDAPTDEQIMKMYHDEKKLFVPNAQATLYGTSAGITSIAYDKGTGLVHVGTPSGRSVFNGLVRVDNTKLVEYNIVALDGLVLSTS